MSRRRLVVVGCGLVGSAVARSAIEKDEWFDDIAILSRSLPEEFIDHPGVHAVAGDVGSGDLAELLRDGDVVVLSAGSPDPRCSPANVNRLLGPSALALAEIIQTAATLHNLRIVLISSGGAVYGPRDQPVGEFESIDPTSVYGAVKASEECMLRPLQGLNGTTVTTVRCSTVYGRRRIGSPAQGLVELAIDRILADETITLFGNGLDRRGYLLDTDLGDVVLALGTHEALKHHTFNACSGQVYTGAAVIDTIAKHLGRQARVELVDGENHHIVLNIDRLRSQLPELSFTRFEDGLAGLIREL